MPSEKTHVQTDQNCNDEVKNVPGISPEGREIVGPFEEDLQRKDDDCEGIDEVEEFPQDNHPWVVWQRQLCRQQGGEGGERWEERKVAKG